MVLNKAGTAVSGVYGRSSGVDRWDMFLGNGNETGSNVGGDFYLQRFDDNGAFLGNAISIQRRDGFTSFGGYVTSDQPIGGTPRFSCREDGFARTTYYYGGGGNVFIDNSSTGSIVQLASTGILSINSNAQKPGGGTRVDSSDIRIKDVIGEYKQGLGAILKLKPCVFTYKGNDTDRPPLNSLGPDERDDKSSPVAPYRNSIHYQDAKDDKEHIGLIAQEVLPVMPEMITQTEGYIDGNKVDDLLKMDTTALIFALVNAVKELAAKVAALEGASR